MSRYVSEGAKMAARAQRSYGRGDGGWYVVNAFTKSPVRGPYETKRRASAVAVARQPPAMQVVYVGDAR